MIEEKRYGTHKISLDMREHLSVSGVKDVLSFDEGSVVADTEMGILIVKGMDIRLSKLNLESGELVVDGMIDSIEYSDNSSLREKGSFFKKLFK